MIYSEAGVGRFCGPGTEYNTKAVNIWIFMIEQAVRKGVMIR